MKYSNRSACLLKDLVFICFLLFCACSEPITVEELGEAPIVIHHASLHVDPGNALRMDLKLSLSEATCLEYACYSLSSSEKIHEVKVEQEQKDYHLKLLFFEERTPYCVRLTIGSGSRRVVRDLYCETTSLPDDLLKLTNLMPDFSYPFSGLVHIGDKNTGTLYLINSDGKIVWFEPTFQKPVICSSYDKLSGSFQAILGFNPEESFTGEYLYSVDMAGRVLLRKHFAEMENPFFHHDFSRLADGGYLILNQVRRNFDLSVWGGGTSQEVVGDGFSVTDQTGKVKFSWSAFDYISPEQDSLILADKGEFQYPPVQDWLHANSVSITPKGNYLISFNRRSEVWKINGENGLPFFRLGKTGDVEIDKEDAFSDRQHAAHIAPCGGLMIFDNGYADKLSRAIVYETDDLAKRARVKICTPLPHTDFSRNQSNAQLIGEDLILYGASVPRRIGITDLYGNLRWQYETDHYFYRAIYIEQKDLHFYFDMNQNK